MTAASATQTAPGKITRPSNAEDALAAHGWDGDKLIAYARKAARGEMTRKGSTLGSKHDDLVSFLVELGCRTAIRYDKDKSSASYSFDSYMYDVMETRIPDFYRRKSEGFGDRRKGHDGRVIALADADPADLNDESLERLFTADRISGWTQAAAKVKFSLEEWITITLDTAARDLLEEAA